MSVSRFASGRRSASDLEDPPCSAGGAAAVGALSKPRGLGGLGAALSLSKVPRTPVQARYDARMLRSLPAGESHRRPLTAILEGMVACVPVPENEVEGERR